jgi:hypothetical protein
VRPASLLLLLLLHEQAGCDDLQVLRCDTPASRRCRAALLCCKVGRLVVKKQDAWVPLCAKVCCSHAIVASF